MTTSGTTVDAQAAATSQFQEIPVLGQYGASYRLTLGRHDKLTTQITAFDPVPLVGSIPPLTTERTYFIKCPDNVVLSQEQQEDFVRREFENGSSLNHVASRLQDESFTINRMVGKGVLSSFGPKRPCLVYEYAGAKEEINFTLERLWPEGFGSSASFLKFAEAFARAIQVIHNQGIVHSFLVPRNIIWNAKQGASIDNLGKQQFIIVGFGYARHADAAGREPYASRDRRHGRLFDRNSWYRAPECRTEKSHVAFGYPADIFSIGAILYSLLLKPASRGLGILEAPSRDVRLLKKTIAEWVTCENSKLIRENENILKIIDSCLRYEPDDRYTCVEELLEAIKIALGADPPSENATQEAHVMPSERLGDGQSWAHLGEPAGRDPLATNLETQSRTTRFFASLRASLDEELVQRNDALRRGHFEVYGHRDRVVMSLCRLLGSARKGDEYCTMTLPDYWTDRNLGSLGRFLTMNKHMARRGVRMRRLFLVSDDFQSLPEEEQVVLENQLVALLSIEAEIRAREVGEGHSGSDRDSPLQLKVLKVSEETIADFERNGQLVAYLKEGRAEGGKNTVCLNFFSTARETWSNGRVIVRRTIRKARYWDPSKIDRVRQFETSLEKFEDSWRSGGLLRDFIHPREQPSPRGVALDALIGARGVV